MAELNLFPIRQVKQLLIKYKYPIFIFVIGILLMLFPLHRSSPPVSDAQEDQHDIPQLEEMLETTLCTVEGAGRTKVLLTLDRSFSHSYQVNGRTRSDNEYEESESETVFLSKGSGQEEPVLIVSEYPTYRGAVVICEGANRPTVKLNIIRAVSSATGLSSEKIAVIPMCSN